MKKVISCSVRFLVIVVAIVCASSSVQVMQENVKNNNVNKTINLSTMALKVIEAEETYKFSAKDTYTGDMTGYVYNCPLCTGSLACAPRYYIKDGTTTYNDLEYGEVRIVASSGNLQCGSIVRFENSRIKDGEILAIVLDRGVLGNDLDLLVESVDYAYSTVGRSSITYDVLRMGWEL